MSIIGMAYALHQAGLFAGLVLMVVVAVITDYSLVIMVRAGHLAGTFTYQVKLLIMLGRRFS
jgi:sodium-coupled neutral amino acid transporter 11